MRRWLKRIAVLTGLLAAGVALRLTVFRPDPVPVTVFRAERGRVEETVVNSRAGTVKSRLRSEMSPGIPGLVVEIAVRKGETVRRDQVLLRLDDREHQAQVALAERTLDMSKALADEARLTADQAQRDRDRAERLASQDAMAETNLDAARTRADASGAALLAARERIRQAEAQVAAAKATLAKTVISAPFDGVVLDIATEVGEWISPSPPGVFLPPVIDLIAPSELYISAPIDEADVARLEPRLPVRITLDAFRGRSFAGTLSYLSSFVETRQDQNRTLTVEATFGEENLPPNLLPGLSADVEIILQARDDVLRVPAYALLEGDRVLVVRGGRLVEQQVTTGLRNWEFAEINSGLQEGDPVVVSLDRPEVVAGALARIVSQSTP